MRALRKKICITAVGILLLIVGVESAIVILHLSGHYSLLPSLAARTRYPELKELQARTRPYGELAAYFKGLARQKGALYAFDILRSASIPPDIDIHLLGHVVGDELYKQKGAEGIKFCTQDFRNACSHSIVIGMLLDHGETALRQIADTCRQAPGGKGAYTMCFHGLGHGVLAYTEYDMKRGVDLCKKTATDASGREEYPQCVGGMTMEMIAGIHNRQQWEKQKNNYFKQDDPLYPCSASFIPREAKEMCYIYVTPHLFQAAGADLGAPTPENFRKAFTFCNAIRPEDATLRTACFGGFGKEFVVLAKNRDIRNIGEMSSEELARAYQWCKLADNTKGVVDCLLNADRSMYWGGENKANAAIGFCAQMSEKPYRSSCFTDVITQAAYFVQDKEYRQSFCTQLPGDIRQECRDRLLVSG